VTCEHGIDEFALEAIRGVERASLAKADQLFDARYLSRNRPNVDGRPLRFGGNPGA
jgi:hypothetical protein